MTRNWYLLWSLRSLSVTRCTLFSPQAIDTVYNVAVSYRHIIFIFYLLANFAGFATFLAHTNHFSHCSVQTFVYFEILRMYAKLGYSFLTQPFSISFKHSGDWDHGLPGIFVAKVCTSR